MFYSPIFFSFLLFLASSYADVSAQRKVVKHESLESFQALQKGPGKRPSLHHTMEKRSKASKAANLQSAKNGKNGIGFPTFTSSFEAEGRTWGYTMVGYPPSSGKTATIPVTIVPIRFTFSGFQDSDIIFDPEVAVQNTINSPIFQHTKWGSVNGQYGDALMRTSFWNMMNEKHSWHVNLNQPKVADVLDITVHAADQKGEVHQFGDTYYGACDDIEFATAVWYYLYYNTKIPHGTLILFLTHNVEGTSFGGYHDLYWDEVNLFNYAVNAWFDPVFPIPDIFVLSHEVAEWLNDPFIQNYTPYWMFPGPSEECDDMNVVEVGDPISNGPDDFNMIAKAKVNGYEYSVQNVVTWEWFTGKKPKVSKNGVRTFPVDGVLKGPAKFCYPVA